VITGIDILHIIVDLYSMFFFEVIPEKQVRDSYQNGDKVPFKSDGRVVDIVLTTITDGEHGFDFLGIDEKGILVEGYYCKVSQVGYLQKAAEI
jgi:hypothetical protein